MAVKGVIYDMDGLMINSEPLHVAAWDTALKKYGHGIGDIPENILSRFYGRKAVELAVFLTGYFRNLPPCDEFYDEKYNAFLKLISKKLEPMPGLLKSLQFFKENECKIALASSGEMKYIRTVLGTLHISEYFSAIISADDVTKGKPDPEPYLLACSRLSLKPEDCLVLEDAAMGIASAKSAGCKCIAVRGTPGQDYSKADLVINSLEEITVKTIKSL
jgi:HAD superfamily hydrolase (TIGR01509 family)